MIIQALLQLFLIMLFITILFPRPRAGRASTGPRSPMAEVGVYPVRPVDDPVLDWLGRPPTRAATRKIGEPTVLDASDLDEQNART